MDMTELQERSDWPELRARLGDLLKLRAFSRGMNANELAQKLGRKPFTVERVFGGITRDGERYASIALALDWSIEEAIAHLGGHDVTLPAPRLRRSDGADEALELPDLPPTEEPMNDDAPDISEDSMTTPLPRLESSSTGPMTFEDHRERLATELKDMITASGKSQTDWARAIGVSQSTISSVLAARHKRRVHYDNLARELGYFITATFALELMPEAAPVEAPAIAPVVPSASVTPSERRAVKVASPVVAPATSSSRLALDDTLVDLIEWSAGQRGIDPKIWLTLAVAAYHESHTEG